MCRTTQTAGGLFAFVNLIWFICLRLYLYLHCKCIFVLVLAFLFILIKKYHGHAKKTIKIQVMTYELHSFVCHHQSHQEVARHHIKSTRVDKKLPRLLVYLSHTFVKRLNLENTQKTTKYVRTYNNSLRMNSLKYFSPQCLFVLK